MRAVWLDWALLACVACGGNGATSPDAGPDASTTIAPLDQVPLPARGYYLGVAPIPADGQSFQDAYLQVASDAEWFPVWGRPSPFWEMATDCAGSWGETFIEDLGRENGMFPLVHFSFFGAGMTLAKPDGMSVATLADPAWRAAYKGAVLEVIASVRPRYVSLGNEVNRWLDAHGSEEGDPNGFQHFVSLYEETYDAVKALSPDTVAFCVFAREIVSDLETADVPAALEMFDASKLDMIAFTTYAHAPAGINSVTDLTDDYYLSAIPHALRAKPFAFTELAWPSIEHFGGQQGQVDFLHAALGRLTRDQGLDLRMAGWPWLHDLDDADETGLIEHDGTPKLVYAAWQAL